MAKCKNCNSEDYEIIYIEEYDYSGDYIRVLAKRVVANVKRSFGLENILILMTAKMYRVKK